MGGVDQRVDRVLDESREARRRPRSRQCEPARLRGRRRSAAGERQRHGKIGAARQTLRQRARFGGAAENENFCWVPVMPAPEKTAADTAALPRWLAIVGIGEDGIDGLSATARGLVGAADIVFGGRRHLTLAAALIRGAARPWPNPFDGAVAEVLQHRGRAVCVLASGDPFHYGVGTLLAQKIAAAEMIVLPAPSAFSLAAARLGWSLPQTTLLSVHGRTLDLLRPHLHPAARILTLTSDGDGPAALARLLAQSGFGRSRLTVLEALGGPRERIRPIEAAAFDLGTVDPLNLVAIEVAAEPGARIIARAPGLADNLFEHDGQITKREVRAMTLSSLAPRRGELLWDIGAGSGSVAIEWMLADPAMRAIAVERRTDRAARIRRNAAAFGVPGLEIVEGGAPDALGRCRPPARCSSAAAPMRGVIDAAIAALRRRRPACCQCGDARNRGAADCTPRRFRRRADTDRDCARRSSRRQNRMAHSDAGDAVDLDKTLTKGAIIAGVGCKRGAPTADIEAAIRAALARGGVCSERARRRRHHRHEAKRIRHRRGGEKARRQIHRCTRS